ncbi:MTH1187 family thiamine-binding protein [candidate division GN15 bacterium]|nr:MTH1187 family thiamine-binding protein [candidate division GN15 bacterium]
MILNLSIFPTSKTTDSASEDVAQVIEIVDKSGLPYKLGPMSTAIEGDWDEIMDVVNKARKKLHEQHNRVYIVMTVDDREGVSGRLTGKIESVEKELGREVKK